MWSTHFGERASDSNFLYDNGNVQAFVAINEFSNTVAIAFWVGNDSNSLDGGSGNDVLTSGSGVDWLVGGLDNDTLNDGDGIDALFGGDGNDIVNGSDVLNGGVGIDVLRGDAGSDTFSFAQPSDGAAAPRPPQTARRTREAPVAGTEVESSSLCLLNRSIGA